jgi:hypothetical protein
MVNGRWPIGHCNDEEGQRALHRLPSSWDCPAPREIPSREVNATVISPFRLPGSLDAISSRAPRYAPELPLRRDVERGRRARARCVRGGRPSRVARRRGVCQLLCDVEQHVWRVLLPSCGARLLSWTWRVSSVWLPVGRPYYLGKQRNSRISEAFLCDFASRIALRTSSFRFREVRRIGLWLRQAAANGGFETSRQAKLNSDPFAVSLGGAEDRACRASRRPTTAAVLSKLAAIQSCERPSAASFSSRRSSRFVQRRLVLFGTLAALEASVQFSRGS